MVHKQTKNRGDMKLNKISLIAATALGALVACSTVVNAQDAKESKPGAREGGKKGMPSVQERLDRMTEELKLTDDQKPKVKAVLEETTNKMKDLRNDNNLSRDQRREKFEAAREDEG